MLTTQEKVVEEVFSLYTQYGSADYIGEPVSQMEHMSQSAELAIREGADDEVILAAFFHDIGHLCVARTPENDMAGLGTVHHEKIGADFLRLKGFPGKIARLVENHVQAKRYLTYRYPQYYNSLSAASKQTLEHQGGRMKEDEAVAFEADSLFEASIQIRKWDEQSKRMYIPIIDLTILKNKATKLLSFSRATSASIY